MTDPKNRILLAIADARFRLGSVLFFCAAVITGFGLYQQGRKDSASWCGVVDQEGSMTGPQLPKNRTADPAFRLGQKLFKANCAACHKPDQKMTGPALKGAKDRWAQSGGDIYAWIKNSQGYLESSGDVYAKELFEEYNKSVMTPNAVSNEDIDAILHYVDNYQQQAIATVRTKDDQFGQVVGFFAR